MDNPAYILPSFEPGERGDFNREFRQHLPIKFEMKDGKMVLDTAYKAPVSTVAAPNVIAANESSNSVHKYIRIIKDQAGNYKIDSSGLAETKLVAPQTSPAQETTSLSANNPSAGHDYLNVFTDEEGRIRVRNSKNETIEKVSASSKATANPSSASKTESSVNAKESTKDIPAKHSYLQVVKDADGRVRIENKNTNN